MTYSSYLYELERDGKRQVNSRRVTEVFVLRNGQWVNPAGRWKAESRPGIYYWQNAGGTRAVGYSLLLFERSLCAES